MECPRNRPPTVLPVVIISENEIYNDPRVRFQDFDQMRLFRLAI